MWLPELVINHVPQRDRGTSWASPEHVETSRPFYEGAWELCRRGILRPGIREYGGQATGDGEGFCVTRHGRRWLRDHGKDQVSPIQTDRFINLLSQHAAQFGAGFQSRAIEAVKCYQAGLSMAACAMCGAAAESVLLALGAAKAKPEEDVVRTYSGRDGRRKTEDIVVRGSKDHVQRAFRGYMELLKYWRDEAAHGLPSELSDDEAFVALIVLARLARFASDELTAGGGK